MNQSAFGNTNQMPGSSGEMPRADMSQSALGTLIKCQDQLVKCLEEK
jgi:hypothetical protein